MQKPNHFKKTVFAILILTSLALLPASGAVAQTVKLYADQGHSNVGFSVSLAGGLSRITGKYNEFEVVVNYVDSDMTKSTIEANIKTASISTGISGRDEHLCAPDFFDAAKYPQITFTSDSIVKSENGFIAYGTFTMHGVSKKILLPFTIAGKDAEGSVGFVSRCSIKRTDYLMGKGDDFVSDEIHVEIDFIAKQKKAK